MKCRFEAAKMASTMSDAAKIISLHNERRFTFLAFADVDENARRDRLVRDLLGDNALSQSIVALVEIHPW
jgi:hypothetical protein